MLITNKMERKNMTCSGEIFSLKILHYLNQFVGVLTKHLRIFLDFFLIAILGSFNQDQEGNIGLQERVRNMVHYSFTQLWSKKENYMLSIVYIFLTIRPQWAEILKLYKYIRIYKLMRLFNKKSRQKQTCLRRSLVFFVILSMAVFRASLLSFLPAWLKKN